MAQEGTHIQHLRTPWSADSSTWREDEYQQGVGNRDQPV